MKPTDNNFSQSYDGQVRRPSFGAPSATLEPIAVSTPPVVVSPSVPAPQLVQPPDNNSDLHFGGSVYTPTLETFSSDQEPVVQAPPIISPELINPVPVTPPVVSPEPITQAPVTPPPISPLASLPPQDTQDTTPETDTSLDEPYNGSTYDSSLETAPTGLTPVIGMTPVDSPQQAIDQPLPSNDIRSDRFSAFKYNRTAFLITAAIVSLMIAIGLGTYFFGGRAAKSATTAQSSSAISSQYAVSNLPLTSLAITSQLKVGTAEQLTINGQLLVNDTVVLAPSTAPVTPVTGQIYYNKTTNQPYYYNGTTFVSLQPTPTAPNVCIQNATDCGFAAAGSGVTTVNGLAGAVTNVCIQNSTNCGFAAAGSGVTTVNGLASALTIANTTGSGTTITIQDASTTQKGIAQFNATDFKATTGVIDTIQGITTTSDVQFASLGLGTTSTTGNLTLGATGSLIANNLTHTGTGHNLVLNSGADNVSFVTGNGANTFFLPTSGGPGQTLCTTAITCAAGGGQAVILEPAGIQTANANLDSIAINKAAGTGNVIRLQTGGVDAFTVNSTGNTTISNTTTITSLQTNSITPTAALTIGATTQSYSLQGNASSTISATNAGSTTAIGFVTPTANVNYQFATAAAGTYSVCTTAVVCAGYTPSSGSSSYLQVQATTPGSAQTGNTNITGTSIAGTFSGSGASLTSLNGSNISSGTVADARLTANVTLQGNIFNGASQLVQLTAGGILPVLSGANLTSLNGTNISSGTVADARLTANVTLQGNTFNGASQLVQLTAGGILPVLSGANLTSLNGSNISSGTVADARLSANVALLNGTGPQTFTGNNKFTGTLLSENASNSTAAFQIQNASATPVLTVDTTTGAQQTILQSASSDATLGAELYPTNNFATDFGTTTGWDVSTPTQATHTAGNTNTITNTTVAITAANVYQVGFTLSGTCGTSSDTLTTTIGGVTLSGAAITGTNCSGAYSYLITAANTNKLAFIPTTSWAGIISLVTIKQITNQTNPALTVKNSSGVATLEVRSSGSTSNIFIGLNSGKNNTSAGTGNTALGTYSLQNNTTGTNNTANGYATLRFNTTGSFNTANGNNALYSNTTGYSNTANGYYALQANTTGTYNTANGNNALTFNTTGFNNTAIGNGTLNTNTTGYQNTATGANALVSNTTGYNNVATGYDVLFSNTTGHSNTATGINALFSTSTGSNNVATGQGALYNNTTGGWNTATGVNALYNLKTLTGTISATATNAGNAQFTSTSTTGLVAGAVVTISGTTSYNGSKTILTVDSGTTFTINTAYSTADSAGAWTTADTNGNTAVGYAAGFGSANGYSAVGNSLLGQQTGNALQTGANYNTLVGYQAGFSITTGANNLLLGFGSGSNLTTGSNNVVINGQAASATGSNQLQIGSGISGDLALGTLNVKTITNSTTGFQVQNTAGTAVLTTDTTNQRVSVGSIGTATGQLYVAGMIPSVTNTLATGATNAQFFTVQGRYAYIANNSTGNFMIIDTTRPANMAVISTTTPTGMSNPYAVAVAGKYAYITNNTDTTNSYGLEILDISNPSAPVMVGHIGTNAANTGGARQLVVQGRYVFLVNNVTNTIQSFDISNPAAPVALASQSTGTTPWSIIIQGRYAYVTNQGTNSFTVFDISNPASIPAGTAWTTSTATPIPIAVSGRYAYVMSSTGASSFQVFDISNPTTPSAAVGSTTGGTTPISITVQGRYAYVAYNGGNFQVFDISNPTAPSSIGTYATGLSAVAGLTVSGRYAYITASTGISSLDLGGTYSQQLEAGGIETGTLQVNNSANFANGVSVAGGLQVGQSLQVSGALAVTGATALQATTITSSSSDAVLAAASVDTASAVQDLNSASWTSTNWTTAANSATHVTGNTSALTNTGFTPTIGTTYQVSYTYSLCSAANTLGVTFAGVTLETTTSCVGTNTKVIVATSTANLTFTPNSTYIGVVSGVKIQAISTQVNTALTVKNSSGVATLEVRSSGSMSNVFIGLNSGQNNTSTGVNNTAVGYLTLWNNTTGTQNSALGYGALRSNTTGLQNTAVGYNSLLSNTTGSYNSGFGVAALQNNTTGTNNTAVGQVALQNNTTGNYNTASGYAALNLNTTGNYNTANGNSALQSNTTGANNIAIGYIALSGNTSGSSNVASGNGALQGNTTGSSNTAIGQSALTSSITGNQNTATGSQALYYLKTLTGTISATATNGGNAQFTSTSTTGLVAGATIIISGTTSYNGSQTILTVDSGTTFTINTAYSTADASGAWTTNSTDNNTAVGYRAGMGSSNGYAAAGNSLLGYETGYNLQTGANNNTFVGYQAGFSVTTGTNNLLLGKNAGTGLTTGSNNVGIGQGVVFASATGSNQLQIGAGISGDLAVGTLVVKTITNNTAGLQVQNTSGTPVFTVDTTTGAQQTILQSASSDATLGSELYPTNNFATDFGTTTGWDVSTPTQATHTAGNTNTITNTTVAITAANVYQVGFTLSGTCGTSSDTITATIGGVTLSGAAITGTNCSGAYSYIIAAANTNKLAFTPTTSWTGTISLVTIKQITNQTNSALTVKNSSGVATLEVRSSGSTLNVFIGLNSGKNNTSSGIQNTALGTNTLQANTTGNDNTAVGYDALFLNTTGTYNTAIGTASLAHNLTGAQNTATGHAALYNNTTGSNNTATGFNALMNNTTGSLNTATGLASLQNNVTGIQNTANGYASLSANTIGSNNTAVGVSALTTNTTGNDNTAVGFNALISNTIGSTNTAVGRTVLLNLKTLTGTISATATNAGKAQFTSTSTTGLVAGATVTISGTTSYNGAQTILTVDSSTTFTINTAYSTADATGAWTTSSTDSNTAVGYKAGYGSSNGYTATNGTYLGYQTGLNLQTGANGNTLLGFSAGSNLTTGANNVVIGQNAQAASNTASNQLQIGAGISGDLALGTLVVKTITNSATGFLVQNTSGSAILTADTTNGQAILGAASSVNGQLKVMNATNANAVTIVSGATSASYSLTLPTAGPAVSQCLQSDASTASQLKFAACSNTHTKKIVLTAEYAGAVLDPGTGANNSGTMTSAIDLTNRENYYKWVTTQATSQSYDVDVQVPVPSDFSSWAGTPVSIDTYTTDTTNGTLQAEVRDTTGTVETAGCNFVAITPSAANAWQTKTGCTIAGTYTAGGYMTLRLRMYATSAVTAVRIGNITLSYNSAY